MEKAQRAVHDAGNQTFHEDAPAEQKSHQIPDRAPLAERNEGAEVAVCIRPRRLASKPQLDLADHMRGFLMRGLGARRHRARRARPRAGGTVADREHGGIARRLQRRVYDELIDAVDLEPVEVAQNRRTLHACWG